MKQNDPDITIFIFFGGNPVYRKLCFGVLYQGAIVRVSQGKKA